MYPLKTKQNLNENAPSGVFVTCKAVEAPSTTRVPVKTPIVEKATLVSLRLCVCGGEKGEEKNKAEKKERNKQKNKKKATRKVGK